MKISRSAYEPQHEKHDKATCAPSGGECDSGCRAEDLIGKCEHKIYHAAKTGFSESRRF